MLVRFYTKENKYSFLASLFFLSGLCMSYYYIAVGNLPFCSAIFTIPFALYFLEKSLENRKYFLVFCLFFVLAFLLHIFMALCLLIFIGFRLLFFNSHNRIKTLLIYIAVPMLLVSFWFVPFLVKTSNFIGSESDFIPSISDLLGINAHVIWGIGVGSIGLVFLFFLISLFIPTSWKFNKPHTFYFYSSLGFLSLLWGILGSYYPTGFGPTRFIIPLFIISCVFLGVLFSQIFKSKYIYFFLLFLILVSLFVNASWINTNYEEHSYSSEKSRYGFLEYIKNNNLPFSNNFSNYRFGTNHYIFSESINYMYPRLSQTRGYYDQSIYYPEEYWSMADAIWNTINVTLLLEYLDWYGIRYFEVEKSEYEKNEIYENESFKIIHEGVFYDYSFRLYEYVHPKPIISIINYSENLTNLNSFNFYFEREIPDKIEIEYNFTGQEAILLKEAYYPSWRGLENPSKNIIPSEITPHNFMLFHPSKGTTNVVLMQYKTNFEIIGWFLTILGVILLVLYTLATYKKPLKADML